VLSNLGDEPPSADPWALALEPVDRWILSRHNRLIGEVDRLMEAYQFGEAARQIYEFLWGEYCDWYIEAAKSRLYGEEDNPPITRIDANEKNNPRITPMDANEKSNPPITRMDANENSETIRGDSRNSWMNSKAAARAVLVHVLERTLRLLHPFMPFVTEEIWQNLPHDGEALIIAPWPEAGPRDEKAEAEMGALMEAVRAIRNARAEYNVEPGKPIEAHIAAGAFATTFASQRDILLRLAKLDPDKVRIAPSLAERPEKALALVLAGVEVYLPLAGMVDIDKERARLAKELDAAARDIARAEKLLGNPGFIAKAPEEVVEAEQEKLTALRERMGRLEEQGKTLA
jgi:valyl-tRNA synthetase